MLSSNKDWRISAPIFAVIAVFASIVKINVECRRAIQTDHNHVGAVINFLELNLQLEHKKVAADTCIKTLRHF